MSSLVHITFFKSLFKLRYALCAMLFAFFEVVLLVLCIFAASATVVHAGITGSKHDLSSKGWGTNEICIFCHTPHNAKTVTGYNAPLWNHQVTTATYTLYNSPSLKQTPVQPRGPSKLCLSCHDGTVAIDAFGNQAGSQFISGSAKLGIDLSNDHPISIYWNHQTVTHGGGAVLFEMPWRP